jgi:phage shock protein E
MKSTTAVLLDVRTEGEFNERSIARSINIPHDQLRERLGELGAKDRAIAVYCQSGRRSAFAAQILRQAGFQDVTNIGSIEDVREP